MKRIILAAFLAVFFLNKAAACTLTTATGGSREAVLIVDVSEREAAASVRLGSRLLNELASRTGDTIYVSIPFAEDIDCYLLYLPLSFLKTDKGIKIELKTPLGTLCVPDGLFKGRRGEYAAVGLRIYDRSVLQKNVLDIIGENTVTEIFAEVDGKPAECASSFITAYLPYIPTAEELTETERIGAVLTEAPDKAGSVAGGYFDCETGFVIFKSGRLGGFAPAFFR